MCSRLLELAWIGREATLAGSVSTVSASEAQMLMYVCFCIRYYFLNPSNNMNCRSLLMAPTSTSNDVRLTSPKRNLTAQPQLSSKMNSKMYAYHGINGSYSFILPMNEVVCVVCWTRMLPFWGGRTPKPPTAFGMTTLTRLHAAELRWNGEASLYLNPFHL